MEPSNKKKKSLLFLSEKCVEEEQKKKLYLLKSNNEINTKRFEMFLRGQNMKVTIKTNEFGGMFSRVEFQ